LNGILGNSHFAMFENNRRQVFGVLPGQCGMT